MTLPEFFGCTFLAFGPPFMMFTLTIAHDPIRIIILVAAAFVWLSALIISALIWFVLVPLREYTWISLILSVIIQELFRYGLYKIIRKTEKGLHEVADDSRISENKHILAYVSGLGFGIMSGAFALVNILADAAGPGTVGLLHGTESFFLNSSAQALCMILLNTFWSVIYFDGFDAENKIQIGYVILTHLIVSSLTLLNVYSLNILTLIVSYFVTILTGIYAAKVAGATAHSVKRFITCQ